MLREIKNVSQIEGESFRRWYTDDMFDLVVWFVSEEPEAEIIGFQLCYQQGNEEKALTWLKDKGFSHNTVDEGEDRPGRPKMSPILMADGIFNKTDVLPLFEQAGKDINHTISGFLIEKIKSYESA